MISELSRSFHMNITVEATSLKCITEWRPDQARLYSATQIYLRVVKAIPNTSDIGAILGISRPCIGTFAV